MLENEATLSIASTIEMCNKTERQSLLFADLLHTRALGAEDAGDWSVPLPFLDQGFHVLQSCEDSGSISISVAVTSR